MTPFVAAFAHLFFQRFGDNASRWPANFRRNKVACAETVVYDKPRRSQEWSIDGSRVDFFIALIISMTRSTRANAPNSNAPNKDRGV